MATMDYVVLAGAAYLFLSQGGSVSGILDKLKKFLAMLGINLGGSATQSDTPFLTTIERWKSLQDCVKDAETKKLLDEVFPLLVKENNSENRT